MPRRIISLVFLLALVGTYAAPLAEAFASTQVMDCCRNGMCPLHKKDAPKRAQHEKMVMCDKDKHSDSSNSTCQASPCSMQEKNVLGVSAYLLPKPARLVFASVTTLNVTSKAQLFISVSQLPETPPPRS
jgi:hypothetical protein